MAASTDGILTHHLQAFGAGDIAGILADYTEGSVLITSDGSALRGPERMRPLFEAFVAEFGKPGATFSMGQRVVEGDVGFITWIADTPDNVYEFGTDTFVIRDGKIATQTFAAKVTPKG
jgi:ketosteroid isomerase-like protein